MPPKLSKKAQVRLVLLQLLELGVRNYDFTQTSLYTTLIDLLDRAAEDLTFNRVGEPLFFHIAISLLRLGDQEFTLDDLPDHDVQTLLTCVTLLSILIEPNLKARNIKFLSQR